MMNMPQFPTLIHENAACTVNDYFNKIDLTDTVLVVNSCARGLAVPESDLDFAILVKPEVSETEIKYLESDWENFSNNNGILNDYKKSNKFRHLHLDIISGIYTPTILEIGAPADNFEIEIGNQICYSAPIGKSGEYFQALRDKWLPYYGEGLRMQRFEMIKNACIYDLDHIPFYVKRGLSIHSFDILFKAFQEYLQALFISCKIYPIAYNKWIKEQVVNYLEMSDLFPKLLQVLSIKDIGSEEILLKVDLLEELLSALR